MAPDEQYQITAWHFHWHFWKPVDCIGGPIRFGWWCETAAPDGTQGSSQSAWQAGIKQSMGILR